MKTHTFAVIICFVIAACILLSACSNVELESPTAATATATSSVRISEKEDNILKILCIGNSFSTDTVEYVPNIALDLGYEDVKIGNLYIGGCSINKHYTNMLADVAGYEYHVNLGNGWMTVYNKSIGDVIKSDNWDWISIQHGTADGSKYADESSYSNLENLVSMIKELADKNTKIAFNMTWVGEPNSHAELQAYANNTQVYYKAIANLTKNTVANTTGIDLVSPTGTGIQNARTADLGSLNRDGYHLSLDVGRYIAGVTFIHALTEKDVSSLNWTPDGVSEYAKAVAVESAINAVKTPYTSTTSTLDKNNFQ